MIIKNSNPQDIDEIFRLYRLASEHQKTRFHVVWPEFERPMVETEIKESRQWKLIIDNQIACIWATTFEDEQIWEDRAQDPAVYIHRIATNPEFRGRNLVQIIVDWARTYAKQNQKSFIRLDTVGNNTKLISLYKNCGFSFLGLFDLKTTDGLPDHYQLGPACLFEIELTY